MFSAGDKIQHYEIIELLGKGGMGEVYLARDTVLDRKVALKFLPDELESDPKTRERFVREARSAAALDHPFICKIYETGEHRGKTFIAMEYISGDTLKDRVEQEPLPLREIIRVTLEIAEALENAHKTGIVHRDLKPANIMLTSQGHTKVMDFGLAKHILPGGKPEDLSRTLTQASLTEGGSIAGTVAYMSPEQATGETLDARSDIFSLGIILYEMLTGKHPFSKSSPVETLTSILRDPAPPPHIKPKSVNPVLNPILRKALAKNPQDRYRNITDFIEDLRKAQRETGGPAWLISRLLPVIGAAVIIIVLAFFVIQKFVRPRPSQAPQAGPQKISVIIADVQNTTGDPIFDGVLESVLSLSLDGAPYITAFDNKQARERARRMKPDSEGRLDLETAQLLCRSLGIQTIISATIEPSGSGYLIRVRGIDPQNSAELVKIEQRITKKEDVFKAAHMLTARLQAGLVKMPADARASLIEETFTTTSLEAMKAYAEAQRLAVRGKENEAIQSYEKAIEYDQNFARAYAGLATCYYNLRDFPNTEINYQKAMSLIAQMPDLMTPREKYRTRGGYYIFKQNFKRAIEEYNALIRDYPKDTAGSTNLALAYFLGYRMEEAYQAGIKAAGLDPESLTARYNLSWYALAAGDFERAEAEARKTLEMEPSDAKAFVVIALAELAQGRGDDAVKVYKQLESLSDLGNALSTAGAADLALYQGRLNEALQTLKNGLAFDAGKKWATYFAADKYLMLGHAYLMQAKKALAIDAADKALETYSGEEIQFAAAQIYIEAGNKDKARNIAGELSKKIQDVHQAYGKLVDGYILLKGGDPTGALRLFDEAQSLVDTWLGRFALGRAYLEAGAFHEALAEFEKCQGRRGEALSVFLMDLPTFRYLDTLDYYIGRAQEGLGSPAAKESYQKYLKIKEKADTGHPLVGDARRRLSLL